MNVFVSYTRRDGVVTDAMLRRLGSHLETICSPFIHALVEKQITHQQLTVLRALFRSHLVILLVSPESFQSPWVRLEIFLARLLLRPIIKIEAKELAAWKDDFPIELNTIS